MSGIAVSTASSSELRLRPDWEGAREVGLIGAVDQLRVSAAQGQENVWLTLALEAVDVARLRLGPNAGEISNVHTWSKPNGTAGCEFTTPLGPVRAAISLHTGNVLRCKSSLLPIQDTRLTEWPRDFYPVESDEGKVHSKQRGLRSGVVYATGRKPAPFSVFYFQNFSSLSEYLIATKRTPADTVGGTWAEFGYSPPTGEDCVLPKAREVVISDAFLLLTPQAPQSEDAIAALYLDTFADVYALVDKPATDYHDWSERAANAMRDLSLSPLCTYVRQGRRFLMPYVGDETKPPESMVQFTVAVNTGEYDAWANRESELAATLRHTATAFFNPEIGSIVRWLPGEAFEDAQAEDNMSHEAMDSWYLHHSLFNLFRIAREGDLAARELFRKSLPYLVRVAHRFDYHWPVFFDLQTLDIIRAEAKPGEGGETDVSGLYALIMIHAHEMFGDTSYLDEAEIAVSRLHGLGFNLAYQLNTTGFAAEAALRLWKSTRKRRYLGLSESCLANLFDNMWMWQCEYEHARHYRTFFGLFPLRDAPYLAPYEELEAHAKFHEYLELGGNDIRPSLKFLLAEYQKYALDRCWYYYPDTLPVDVIADKTRNGSIVRRLSVPLEDLQDGREQSGQVGQELYGAGLPFIMTSRHYMRLVSADIMAYCDYPMFDFQSTSAGGSWRVGGNPRGSCTLRIMPADANAEPRSVSVSVSAGNVAVPVRGRISPEGHALFQLRGGQTLEITCSPAAESADDAPIVGAMASSGRH